ncbi:MAG: hypothetical protein V4467_00595 [Patescibacteria group bacterium]
MGNMEVESRKRARKHQLQEIILQTVASAGILAIALLAPNVLQSLKKLGIIKSARQLEIIHNSRKRLVEKGLLFYDAHGFLKLSPKGQSILRHFELHNFRIMKPKRWDKKWRVVIFDIREGNRKTRDLLRKTLSNIGFIKLQQSVWVYPYDCEDFITMLKADFKIGKAVLYMIVDSIENDTEIRKNFGLK